MGFLRRLVSAVVAGRVTLYEGSGRRRLEVQLDDGDVRHTTEYKAGCLPVPFWQRKAQVTRFAPYW